MQRMLFDLPRRVPGENWKRFTSSFLFPYRNLLTHLLGIKIPGGSLLYSFADCTLNADQRELRRNGDLIAVTPQVFDLLEYLICNRERVVSKDDLISAVWKGRIVSESTLTTRINGARCAIGDSGNDQRLIRTLPRKGIRFVGAVREERVLPTSSPQSVERQTEPPGRPDRTSIAVLPFNNISGDQEQEYFADGMAEDIITALSRFKLLFVIARNSSFTYKGKAVDVKQVGRELGVQYVLEGSVRKAASRVRITGELVDTATGAQLWADQFEGGLGDIFDLQDKLTERVIGAIAPELQQAEIERARHKPTESLGAYDLFLRGMAREVADLAGGLEQPTSEGTSEALSLFYGAIKLDSRFAAAHGMAALCYAQRKAFGWVTDREEEIAEARRLARRAIQMGKEDAVALATGGYVLAFVVHELEAGIAAIERALAMNPNFSTAWLFLGWAKVWVGQCDAAIEHLERAMRLSPLGRGIAGMQAAVAHAHFFSGRHDEACTWAERLLREYPDSHPGLRIAAASNAAAGRTEQAEKAVARLRQLDPALRATNLRNALGPYPLRALSKYEEAIRQAGLE